MGSSRGAVSSLFGLFLLVSVLAAGCATTSGGDPQTLKSATAAAWSVKGTDSKMAIAVSPVRRTVQIAGASAAILGAAFDAAANAQYRSDIEAALGDYDPGKVFEARLKARLDEVLPGKLEQVPPPETASSQKQQKEADKQRIQGLRRAGKGSLLDLRATFGIFGPEGTLVAKLDGDLLELTQGKRVWKNAMVASTEPIMASAPLADPTKTMMPNLSSPRFSAEKDAITQWTQDGGDRFKAEYERSVDAVISALLCDLKLVREAQGEYHLGKLAMARKKFDEAEQHFKNAYAIDGSFADALNGMAVNLGHQKNYDEAIDFGNRVIERFPDYAPIQMNMAWWYAIGQKDTVAARPYYEKALALGIPAEPKIEKALEKGKK